MPLINPKNRQEELTTPENQNPNLLINIHISQNILFCINLLVIIIATTNLNVINSNRKFSWISPLWPRVGALVAPSQDNWNFHLCLHLNTSSLRSFNNSLRSLKLFILIFSSIHKLYLPLKLLAVEDCLTIFQFTWRVGPWSLRLKNI